MDLNNINCYSNIKEKWRKKYINICYRNIGHVTKSKIKINKYLGWQFL